MTVIVRREDPEQAIRRTSRPFSRARGAAVLRALVILVLVVVAAALTAIAAQRLHAPQTTAAAPAPSSSASSTPTASATTPAADRRTACLGAASRTAACAKVSLGSTAYPDAASVSGDSALQYDCFTATYGKLTSCHYGSRESNALRVAFVGDNRAASLLPGVLEQLPSANWNLTTYLGDGCVLSTTAVQRCSGAQNAIISAVTAKGAYDLVITTADRADGLTIASFTTVFQRIRAAGAKLAVIQDTPHPSASALACSSREGVDPLKQPCNTPRAQALLILDPLVEAANDSGAALVNLTPYFCTATQCPAIIGDVVVYRDAGSDLTTTFSRTLGPLVVDAVKKQAKL